jgi:hypothetical protein
MSYTTDADRYQFMRDCVSTTTRTVLNVGCHIDGAGLRMMAPYRVINCDIQVQPGYDYIVDSFFDVRGEWPFTDRSVELVVLADILEHLYDLEIAAALGSARRVSEKLCVTVPHDTLLQDEIDPEAGYKAHCNTIDEEHIKRLIELTAWEITDFHVIRYAGGPVESEGYLVSAR